MAEEILEGQGTTDIQEQPQEQETIEQEEVVEQPQEIEQVEQQDQQVPQPPTKMSVKDFASKIKAKYPAYANVDDNQLVTKMLEKYPVYKDKVELTPQQSVKPITQKKEFDFEKTINSGLFNTKSDATRVVKPITEQAIKQVEQSRVTKNVAIDNTVDRRLKNKGITAPKNSPTYISEKKKVQQAIDDGDAIVSKNPITGEPVLAQTTGFWESLWNSGKEAVRNEEEASDFVNKMTTEQRVEYANRKAKEVKVSPEGYVGEVPTEFAGATGQLIGGVTPFMAKATLGGLTGAALVAAAPVTGGASLAGIPALLAATATATGGFAATVGDMVNQGGKDEVMRRYMLLKERNPQLPDIEAMKEAEKGLLSGEIAGGITNMAFMGAGGALTEGIGKKMLSDESKNVIGKYMKSTLKSASKLPKTYVGEAIKSGVKMGAIISTTEAGKEIEAGLEDKKLRLSREQIIDNLANSFVENAKVGTILHALSTSPRLPGLIKSTFKGALAKENPAELAQTLRNNEVIGNIPPGSTERVMTDILEFNDALGKTSDGLNPETQISVAGLIQKRDKLTSEMASKDPTQVESYKQQIDALDEQIKKITESNDPFEHEVNVVGEKLSTPTEKVYRVEYFDPETGKMTHKLFPDEQSGTAFTKSLSGEQTRYGTQGYYEKYEGGKIEGVSELPEEIKTKVYDTENITGVPSKIGIGEELVQAKPIEGGGAQAVSGGGVLQENVPSGEVKVEEKSQEKPLEAVEQKEVIRQMKPFTDRMAEIEREFKNNQFEIDTDYDNEIIVTDKKGEIVDAEELPDNLRKLAADYEKATSKLGDFDNTAMQKALAESRKVTETEAVEVKPAELPKAEEKPKVFSIDNKEDFYHGSYNKREGRLRANTAEQFGDAIYFTTSKEEAEGNYPHVTKVKLNIENPIYAGEGNWSEVEKLALEKENANKERDEDGNIIEEVFDLADIQNSKNISDAAKELGYDAIILRGEGNHENETAVLDPSKIIYPEDVAEKKLKTELPIKLPKEAKEVYHYSNIEDLKDLEDREGGTWFTENPSGYQMRGGAKSKISKVIEPSKLNLIKEKDVWKIGDGNWKEGIKKAKESGYDGVYQVVDGDKHYLIFDIKNKTKNKGDYAIREEVSRAVQPTSEVPKEQKVEARVQPSAERVSEGKPEAAASVLSKDNIFPFETKSKKQIVKRDKEGGIVFVTNKEGGKVSRTTEKKALREYAKAFDFSVGKTSEESGKEIFSTLDKVLATENPLELAEIYANEEPIGQSLSTTEAMIADFGLGKTTNRSFAEHADRNFITTTLAKAYLDKKGTGLDIMAQEMSHHYFPEGDGNEISPEDLANFMIRFPSGDRGAYRMLESETALESADKFQKLTGLILNREIADIAINQKIEKYIAEEKALAQILEKEYDSQADLESEFNDLWNSTNGFEEGSYKLSDGTTVTIEKDGTIKSKKYESKAKDYEPAKEIPISEVIRESEKIERGEAEPVKPIEPAEPRRRAKKEPGRFEQESQKFADKIKAVELPKWLQTPDKDITKRGGGLSPEQLRDMLADAVVTMGKLMDKGVEFSQAVKVAVKQLIKAQGEENRDAIEKGFSEYYKANVGEKPPTERLPEMKIGEGELRGIRMEDNAERRAEIGMPERQANPESVEQWRAKAQEEISKGYNINKLIDKMGNGDMLSPVENEISRIFASTLDNEVKRNPSNENINAYKRFIQAREKASSKIGQSLRSLQGVSNPFENISDFFVAKMESLKVDELTESQIAETKKDFENIQTAKEEYRKKYEEAESKLAEIKAQNELLRQKKEKVQGKVYTQEGKRDFKAERENLKQKLRDAVQKYKNNANKLGISADGGAENFAISVDMAKIISDIAKSHVEEVGAKLVEVTKRTLDDVKDIFDGITEKDIRDVIAGKYSERKETKSELQANINQIRSEAKLLNELDRVLASEPKTEQQRIERNQELASLRKQVNEVKKKNGLDEYSDEARIKKAIEANKRKEQELKERLDKGDFEPQEKKQSVYESPEFKKKYPQLYKELLDSRIAKEKAELEFNRKLIEEEMKSMSKFDKIKQALIKTRGTIKSFYASIDNSAVGVQVWAGIVRHPVIGAKSIINQIIDAFSGKSFERRLTELHESPDYYIMRDSGLSIYEPESLSEKAKDEFFPTRFKAIIKLNGKEYGLLNIGGKKYELFDVLKPFERAFTSLGNSFRVIKFRTDAQKLYDKGITFDNKPEEFKALASRINALTSASEPGKAFKSGITNIAIWSPRLLATKLNILGISDLASFTPLVEKGYYRSLGEKGKVLSRQQLYAAADLARFATTVVAGSYLFASARGGKLNTDPYDDDFMDIELPNGKSYNFTGGFSKYIGTLFQFISGGEVSRLTGKYQKYSGFKDRGSEILHFMRGKMPPVSGSIVNLAVGKDYTGKETSLSSEAERFKMPMAIAQISKQIDKDGYSALYGDAIPTFMGINVKDTRDYSKPKALFEESEFNSPEMKILLDKDIVPAIRKKEQYKVKVDIKHPDGLMTDEEFDIFVELTKKYMKEGFDDEKSIKDILESDYLVQRIVNGDVVEENYVKGKNLDKEKLSNKISSLKQKAVNKAKFEMGFDEDKVIVKEE